MIRLATLAVFLAFPVAAGAQTEFDASQIASEMVAVLRAPRAEIMGQIKSDCAFRHPDSREIQGSCEWRQQSLYDTIVAQWKARSTANTAGIIVWCMNENRSLHGFDWQHVSWCFERMTVEMRSRVDAKP